MTEALIVDCESGEETRRALTKAEVTQQHRDAEAAVDVRSESVTITVDTAALADARAAVADAADVEALREATLAALELLVPAS